MPFSAKVPCRFATVGAGVAFTLVLTWSPADAGRASAVPMSADLEATLERAHATDRPVVIVFHAAWCPLCSRMERETFRDPAVTALADRFLWVEVDIDRNPAPARERGVDAVPTIHLLEPGGGTVGAIEGMQDGARLGDNLTRFLEALESGAAPPVFDAGPQPRRSELVWRPKGYRGTGMCFSHVGYGPLRLFSQSPFQALRLGILPSAPSTLRRGQVEVHASSTWVNVWAVDNEPGDPGDYFLDYEMLQANAAVGYGITDAIVIEGRFRNRTRFGGAMDPFIQGFHDLFGIAQNGRDAVPRGLFRFDLEPPGRPPVSLDNGDRGTFSRSVQLSIQHNLSCGTARLPALSYSATVQYELLDDDVSGGGNVDLGVSVAASRRFGRVYLYAILGHAFFGDDEFRGVALESNQFTFLLAGEWRFLPRHSLVAQYLATEGLLEDFEPFSDLSQEATLGWKWEIRDLGVLEVGAVENILSFDNGPDFGFHAGFSQRF